MKNNGTNSSHMKFLNRQVILNIISKNPISRAELARMTGLTRAAISLLVDEFVNEGIVTEIGTTIAKFGRKPVLLDIKPDCYYSIGLDLSRSGCNCGIVDMKGKVKIKREILLTDKDLNNSIKAICEGIRKVISDSSIAEEKILGIGVSCPGPLDILNGIILNPPNFNLWHGINIAHLLNEKLHLKVFLENNSIALALAEKNFGRGTKYSNFFLMVVGTGIGAGIIINNKPYRGARGFGGEIGHTSIDINGKVCNCGNIGCVEIYASIPAIMKEARLTDSNLKEWEDVVDRAEAGVEICRKIINNEARYLSSGIVNAMNILDLDAVILTGKIRYKPKMLINKIKEYVDSFSITRDIQKIDVLTSSIEKDIESISSAGIVIDHFFNQ